MLEFSFKIIVSPRRKTVGIHVTSSDEVLVLAPRGVSEGRVREILERRSGWVMERIRANAEKSAARLGYVSGEDVPCLGIPRRLVVQRGLAASVALDGNELRVSIPGYVPEADQPNSVRLLISEWMMRMASSDLAKRVAAYGPIVGIRPARLRLRLMRSRWGSCTSTGTVTFNWLIMMAPEKVIDYLVVHELCHLVHLNHSPEYWALVESVMPGYRECRAWLKREGHRVTL